MNLVIQDCLQCQVNANLYISPESNSLTHLASPLSTGNQRLRLIVDTFVERYANSTSRQDKSDILSTIVNTVRGSSPHGGFVKEDTTTGRWFEVGDFLAREKVSQAFRDALSHSYRSSKKFKHEKRRKRDKAAKLAKQMAEGKSEASAKPPKKQSGAARKAPSSPLQRRGKLSVLREEKTSPSMAYIPAGQGNAEPNHPSGMMSAGMDSFQAAQNQYRSDPSGSHYGAQGGMLSQEVGNSSWPRLFPQGNPMFNPMHGGMNSQTAAMAQQRRFSEAMMIGNSSNMMSGPQSFHHPDPNTNWSSQMEYHPGAGAPSLHASFPNGMDLHGQPLGGPGGMFGMNSAPAMAAMPQEQMAMPRLQQQRSRSLPVARTFSSSSAIVSRLESALPELAHSQDENPFEPVPLPADAEQENDNESILDDW